ncbi:aminopeptidase P family protein [soil metagenome]
MKYAPIDKQLFIENRRNFTELLKSKSVAVFNSNDILPTNADGTLPFRQNNDLFYLSGIDQEETILVIAPDFYDKSYREILFIKETDEKIALWEGHKYTKEEAYETSGIKSIFWLSQFEQIFNTIIVEAEHIYLNSNEHIRANVDTETRDARFLKWCMSKYPLFKYERSAPLMGYLRAVKSEPEISLIQKACNITEKGFRRILKFVKPGVNEYEIEAELIHEFIRNRSRGFAYQPIIASGANACVLHYIANNQACKEGEILLMDVGAEYANYNSDLTRSIPVKGRYSKRQKDVYNAVLRVMKGSMDILRPGAVIPEYHKEVGLIMESELINLGLIDKTDVKNQDSKNPLYKKYFMHGTSHHLGLDVHDVGNIYRKIEKNMVFTVEPGIYIPEEGLGIRLENNVVVNEDSVLDLMKNIPLEIEEIEDLMNS